MRFKHARIRVAASLLVFVLVILVGGFIYQAVATARERQRYPPIGRLVDGGGYRLHLYCLGMGSPTVVFESGFGMSLNAWALVQPAVARFTRACSYDRPGYGWSDKPPDPRTGMRAAEDLHRALGNASILGPYVLVGHSMGGGQARLFASRYRSDVAGIVIVASGHEDWRIRNPAVGAEQDGIDRFIRLAAFLSHVGLSRLLGVLFRPAMAQEYVVDLRKYLPPRAAESEIAYLAQAKHVQAMADEIRTTPETEAQLRSARDFGDIPLIVLSERWVFSEKPSVREREAARIEDELQTELSRFSRKGKHVQVNSGHLIPLEKPDVIVEAIREVLLR